MAIITWSEQLEIGIKSIDDQHRYLIDIINELHLAVEFNKGHEAILPIIDRLHDYAETHFKEEEALLEQHHFPGKLDHIQEHDAFIARLHELKNTYESCSETLTINVRNFILGWLFNHIRMNDMEYKHFLEQKKVL
jgi:hemerythrin